MLIDFLARRWPFFFIIALLVASLAKASQIEISFSTTGDFPPFFFKSDPIGIVPDILDKCIDSRDYKLTYVAESIHRAGRIALGDTGVKGGELSLKRKVKGREQLYSFSDEPIYNVSYVPIVRSADKREITKFSDLDSHILGHTKGFEISQSYLSYLKVRKAQKGVIETRSKTDVNLKLLINHRIGVFFDVRQTLEWYIRELNLGSKVSILDFELGKNSYYLAFRKSSSFENKKILLNEFDKCLRNLKNSSTYCDILKKYNLPCLN